MSQLTTFKATLTGICPLLMHSEILVDAMHPKVRVHKQLTAKKKKTEADLEAIKRSEWELGMYRDNDAPAVPVDWILAAVKGGARKVKLGKQAEGGVLPTVAWFPLEYKGPKDLEGMWASGEFLDYRGVRNQNAKVMRARPRFNEWKLRIELDINEDVINPGDVFAALELVGATIGIGDYRPRFGRFNVKRG